MGVGAIRHRCLASLSRFKLQSDNAASGNDWPFVSRVQLLEARQAPYSKAASTLRGCGDSANTPGWPGVREARKTRCHSVGSGS